MIKRVLALLTEGVKFLRQWLDPRNVAARRRRSIINKLNKLNEKRFLIESRIRGCDDEDKKAKYSLQLSNIIICINRLRRQLTDIR